MRAVTRLQRLEKHIEETCGEYVKNAPFRVLEKIVADDYLPTWAQILAGDYESANEANRAIDQGS